MSQLDLFDSRPVFSIRRSKRSRRIRLTANPRDGIVIHLPTGVSEEMVPEILQVHRRWIEKAQAALEVERVRLARRLAAAPPTEVDLMCLNERWVVKIDRSARRTAADDAEKRIVINDPEDKGEWTQYLKNWLKAQANNALPPMVHAAASATGLSFEKVRVGLQKTRWGSCSSHGTISLNARLLLIPEYLARYIIVHELCHTVHMNHSPSFWKRVARYEPDYHDHRRIMRKLWRKMPAWLDG